MARTEVTVENVNTEGKSLSLTSAIADGHSFKHGKDVKLLILNDDASPHTITIPTNYSRAGLSLPDADHVVAAGERYVIEDIDDVFIQAGGLVHVDYDSPTGISIAVWR